MCSVVQLGQNPFRHIKQLTLKTPSPPVENLTSFSTFLYYFFLLQGEEDDNPMASVVDSILQVGLSICLVFFKHYFQMFIMTLGGFQDIWDEIPNTEHELIGLFIFSNLN